MTPREALLDLVARVGARDGAAVRSERDRCTPVAGRGRLGSQGAPAPGSGAACQGPWSVPAAKPTASCRCRRSPQGRRARRRASSFATNGATSTGSRSPRPTWTSGSVMPRRSRGLSSRNWACAGAGTGSTSQGRGPLGLAAGDTRHQMLGLRTHGDVTLVVADTAVALADLIDFEHGAYVLDTAAIRHLVDAATTADPRYTPSTTRREAQHARHAGPVRALANGLPRAEAAAPADVRRVVRPAACQARDCGRLPREHHPQTHDRTARGRHAGRLRRRGHGKAAWSRRRRSVGSGGPSRAGTPHLRACRVMCILRSRVNI